MDALKGSILWGTEEIVHAKSCNSASVLVLVGGCVFSPALALLLGYTLQQLPGEGCLGRASGQEGGPPWYNWEWRYGHPRIILVCIWDWNMLSSEVRQMCSGDELLFWPSLHIGNGFCSILCHSDVGPAKSHSIAPLSVGARDGGLAEVLYLCMQTAMGEPSDLQRTGKVIAEWKPISCWLLYVSSGYQNKLNKPMLNCL